MSGVERAIPDGRLAGRRIDGVDSFLGIPYAAPPVGALRLRSPRPVAAWSGVHDACLPGPASLQTLGGNQTWLNEPLAAQSEDCLTLNVWAPAVAREAPVLVWLHGGATRNGYGASAAIDGSVLAREQGLVVVTINYRLGALGGLAHPALRDDETGTCANWGLQDKLAALAWVRRSIAAFGGDPAKVTLAGQSSGAANAALIAQNRLAEGLFCGLILQSPPLFRPPMFAELEGAAEYTELVANKLEVSVPGLREVDGTTVQRVEQQLASSPELAAGMGRPRTAPIRDGVLVRAWSYDAPCFDMPLLAGWTHDEANFWFDLYAEDGRRISPLTAPENLAEFGKRSVGIGKLHYAFPDRPGPDLLAERYGAAADVAQAWCALYTDIVFKAPILHLLGRQARSGAPAWAYEFAWSLPAPGRGAPHAVDVPFVFGTTGTPHVEAKIGATGEVAAVSAAMRAAWGRFVREGSPGEGWPEFDPRSPMVRHFGGEAEVIPLEGRERLAAWPAYAA